MCTAPAARPAPVQPVQAEEGSGLPEGGGLSLGRLQQVWIVQQVGGWAATPRTHACMHVDDNTSLVPASMPLLCCSTATTALWEMQLTAAGCAPPQWAPPTCRPSSKLRRQAWQ